MQILLVSCGNYISRGSRLASRLFFLLGKEVGGEVLGHALIAAGEGVAGERDDEARGVEAVEEAFACAAFDLLETSSPGLVRALKDLHSQSDGRFDLDARAIRRSFFRACFRDCFKACQVQTPPLLPFSVEVIGITRQ